MNEIKRLFRLGVLLMVIAIMASCSKNDYKLIVPSNCTALMSVDLSQLSATGIGQKIGSLLMVDNADNSGIDFKSKLYLFETTDGVVESPILKDYYNALSSLDSRSYVVESSILQNYYNFVFVELLWKVLFERPLQQTMLKFGDRRSCGKPRFGELLQQ